MEQRRIKIAFLLLVVFTSPFLVKATHFLYVHHGHHKCVFSEETVLVEKHKKCPICAFDYAVHQKNDPQHVPSKHEIVADLYTVTSPKSVAAVPVFSFHLRAPPSV